MDYSTFISPALGIIVGLLMGLTGAGGGILSVPLLVFVLHMPVAQAAPISLSAIALSAGVGALLGLKNKILRYKAAGFMAIFGLILSPLGLWIAQKVPNAPLLILFSCTLFFVSTRLLLQARREMLRLPDPERKPPPCLLHPEIGKLRWNLPCARSLMFSGSLAGFLSGLLGVGGGFVATSLGVLALISTGGVIFSAISGNFDLSLAAPFSIGALTGLLLGREIGKKISGPRLQQIFALLALAVAISLGIKGILAL